MSAAPKPSKGGASARGVSYATSPLLASKTPPWRSRFLVALVGLAFAGLLGRAVWLQVIHKDFIQKQGEARYAHTLELPASRGRIVDRSGQVLASSVAVPSIWAFPKEVDTDPEKRAATAATTRSCWGTSTTVKVLNFVPPGSHFQFEPEAMSSVNLDFGFL
jgi:cell division protein FtsI (penicillin-binding protein 3)